MRCIRASVRAVLAGFTLTTLLCANARALEDDGAGPIVVGAHTNPPLFNIAPVTGSFNFDNFYEHDTSRQQGVTTGTTDNRSQETLSLLTNGYLLNPDFMYLTAGGTIGLQQESFSEPGAHQYTNTVLDGWNLTDVVRRDDGAPLTLYTQRSEQILTPDFSPSLQSIDTSYGGTLNWQSETAPTEVQLYHENETQTEAGGALQYKLVQDVASWHTDVINLPHQALTWDFNYQNTTEQEYNSPQVHYETYNASLTHVLTFGPQEAGSLTSALSLDDQIGDLGYDDLHFDENLELQNSPTFQTHYDYSLDSTLIDGDQQTSHKFDVGFVHHLFASLVTNADAGASFFNETGGAATQQYFGRVNFGYRKIIPCGLLLSNLNLGYSWQNSTEGDQVIHIINQPETFTNSQPLALTQTNIDPSSIVVLSASGVPYLKSRDFTVSRVGNLTQVERIVGGLIPPDATVKLDYDLLPQPSNTLSTATLGVNTRYEIEQGPLAGLAPYIRYGLQRESIDTADTAAFVPDSYNDTVIGADYRIWKLIFNAEQEWYDSTLIPFNATRFSAHYVDQLSPSASASIQGSYAHLDYYSEQDEVDDTSFTADFEDRLNTDWSVTARLVWLDDRDQLFGNTQALEEQVEADWSHNQTKAFVRVRNSTLTTGDERNTFQTFELGLSRSF